MSKKDVLETACEMVEYIRERIKKRDFKDMDDINNGLIAIFSFINGAILMVKDEKGELERFRKYILGRHSVIENNIAIEELSANPVKLQAEKTALAEIEGIIQEFKLEAGND